MSAGASEAVRIATPRGEELAVALHLPAGPGPAGPGPAAVVLCHGLESSKDGPKHVQLAGALAAAGLTAVRFDFAGCGESDGAFVAMTCGREVEDLDSVVAWLAEERGVERVGLFGSSLGGAVALLLAGWPAADLPPIAAVAVLASVGHPARLARRLTPPDALARWRREGALPLEGGRRLGWRWLEDAERRDAIEAAGRIRAPVLVVHGSEDDVVPESEAHAIHGALPPGASELVIVDGAGHRFDGPGQLDPVLQRIERWFRRHLLDGAGAPGDDC